MLCVFYRERKVEREREGGGGGRRLGVWPLGDPPEKMDEETEELASMKPKREKVMVGG